MTADHPLWATILIMLILVDIYLFGKQCSVNNANPFLTAFEISVLVILLFNCAL